MVGGTWAWDENGKIVAFRPLRRVIRRDLMVIGMVSVGEGMHAEVGSSMMAGILEFAQ